MNHQGNISLSKRIASLRILFGVIWAIDAVFKFQPAFYKGQNLLVYVKSRDSGEPSWMNTWYHFWYHVININPELFAIIILIIEVAIALSLLFGIARRLNYALAIPFSFLIWGVGEAFGGPYVTGSTDIGAGFIYVVEFLMLYTADGLVKPSWSLDPWLEKQLSWWHKIASPPALVKVNDRKS